MGLQVYRKLEDLTLIVARLEAVERNRAAFQHKAAGSVFVFSSADEEHRQMGMTWAKLLDKPAGREGTLSVIWTQKHYGLSVATSSTS